MIIEITREYDIDLVELFANFSGDVRQMMDDNMSEEDIVRALIAEYGFDEVLYDAPTYESFNVI